MPRIYLDHNATTPLAREVADEVARVSLACGGNPSSLHEEGRRARDVVERARDEVAALVGARSDEIVFTSGGTEADHLGVVAGARAARARSAGRRRRVVASTVEHPAVGGALAALAAEGFEIVRAPVTRDGSLDRDALAAAVDDGTALVAWQLANHELGNLYPVAEIARLAHAAGALCHCDAVQAAGRVPVDVSALGVDLLAISAHKIHGPKGVGALYQRRGLELAAPIGGGHQERGRRPGTESVAAIAGFAVACRRAQRLLPSESTRIAALRERLERGALSLAGARRYGAVDAAARVPGTSCLAFAGVPGELLAINLDLAGVAVSTGAACTSGSLDPSPVVLALGATRAEALEATRFSLGEDNTEAEVDAVLALLPALVARVLAVCAVDAAV